MNTNALDEVGRALSELIVDKNARVNVSVVTGSDESILVGAADGYLRFALALVEFVRQAQNGKASLMHCDGHTVPSASLGDVCVSGEVRIDSGCLAQDEAE